MRWALSSSSRSGRSPTREAGGRSCSAPASGAFVGLSQTALADLEPERHEQAMARWTLAGSVGVAAGPLLLAGVVAAGGGWRACFLALGVACAPLLVVGRRL